MRLASGLLGTAISGFFFLVIAGGAVAVLLTAVVVAWPWGSLALLFPAFIGFAVWRGWGDTP